MITGLSSGSTAWTTTAFGTSVTLVKPPLDTPWLVLADIALLTQPPDDHPVFCASADSAKPTIRAPPRRELYTWETSLRGTEARSNRLRVTLDQRMPRRHDRHQQRARKHDACAVQPELVGVGSHGAAVCSRHH